MVELYMHAAVVFQANQQQLQYNSLIPKFLILAPQVTEFLNSSSLLRTGHTSLSPQIRCVTSPESLSPPQLGTTIFHTCCVVLVELDIDLVSISMHTSHRSTSTCSPMVNSVSKLMHNLEARSLHCTTKLAQKGLDFLSWCVMHACMRIYILSTCTCIIYIDIHVYMLRQLPQAMDQQFFDQFQCIKQ